MLALNARDAAAQAPARLAVEALSWGPAGGPAVISDLDFAVVPREMLAVVGPNGAGKSSLLRCLYRFNRPRAGGVRLDGADIWALSPRAVARRIAAVLQEPIADFGLSAAEIVELGLLPHGRCPAAYGAIEAALEILGLAGLGPRDFGTLSGGEKQRVMIARALVHRPDLIILDEPTNHLDIRHQHEVLALLKNLATTVVVCLHDLALAAAYADRVLLLEGGRVAALGSPAAVLTPAAVRRAFGVEAAFDRHPATGAPRLSIHLGQ